MNNNNEKNGENVKAINPKATPKATAKGIVESVKDIESQLPRIVAAVNNAFRQLDKRMEEQDEILQAVAEVVGRDQVQEAVNRRQAEREKAQLEAAEAQLKSQLEAGTLVLSTVITEDSLLVGVEYDEAGKPVGMGRVQVPVAKLTPELKAEALGKGPGHKISTPAKTQFEVLDIYEKAAPPAPVVATVEATPEVQALPESPNQATQAQPGA
jgi:hypothetical protein